MEGAREPGGGGSVSSEGMVTPPGGGAKFKWAQVFHLFIDGADLLVLKPVFLNEIPEETQSCLFVCIPQWLGVGWGLHLSVSLSSCLPFPPTSAAPRLLHLQSLRGKSNRQVCYI